MIQETCDPEWDELFYFPMQYISLTTDKMVCNLYDHDLGYHEFMGWAEVGLSTLPRLSQPVNEKQKGKATKDADAQKHDMWLPLALPPGMETSSYWKKYVSFEGDVPVTGACLHMLCKSVLSPTSRRFIGTHAQLGALNVARCSAGEIHITVWAGTRKDKEHMKYAQPATRAYHVSSSDTKRECARPS